MARKKLPIPTLKLILARSAGYCENPDCNRDLFPFFVNKTFVDINEAAHIISFARDGPRANQEARTNLDQPMNIILLCPTCHSMIDKAPSNFPARLLYQWKEDHEKRVTELFSNEKLQTRDDLSRRLTPLLQENRSIYEKYGPIKQKEVVLLSDDKEQWDRNVLQTIIPNNRTILAILTQNLELLTVDEIKGLSDFKLHKEAFEFSHLTKIRNASTPLFPEWFFNSLIKR